jgi:hypothetical protein
VRNHFAIVVFILVSVSAEAKLYKHVDKNGVVTYSDVPPKQSSGVSEVEEKKPTSMASQAPSVSGTPKGAQKDIDVYGLTSGTDGYTDEAANRHYAVYCIEKTMPQASDAEKTAALDKLMSQNRFRASDLEALVKKSGQPSFGKGMNTGMARKNLADKCP